MKGNAVLIPVYAPPSPPPDLGGGFEDLVVSILATSVDVGRLPIPLRHGNGLRVRWKGPGGVRLMWLGSRCDGRVRRVARWVEDVKAWEVETVGSGPFGRLTGHLNRSVLGRLLWEYLEERRGGSPVVVPSPDLEGLREGSEAALRLVESLGPG